MNLLIIIISIIVVIWVIAGLIKVFEWLAGG